MSLFSDRVNELRKSKGLSKSKLLKDLELNQNSFVNWEKRGTIPSAEIVSRIALYLGTTVEYLIGEPDNPEPSPPDDRWKRYEDQINELPESSQERLMKQIQAMIEIEKELRNEKLS